MKLVTMSCCLLFTLCACSEKLKNGILQDSRQPASLSVTGKNACAEQQCGPRPLMANTLCADGKTTAGPVACEEQATGACGWTIVTCPADKDGCTAAQCGPKPDMPNTLCSDGKTTSGPTGCEKQKDGSCSWTMVDCPPPVLGDPCSESECGPKPGMANGMCSDGKTVSGVGPCIRQADLKCGWTFVTCPDNPGQNAGQNSACRPEECGPQIKAIATICPDGKTVSGPGSCERTKDGGCAWTMATCP